MFPYQFPLESSQDGEGEVAGDVLAGAAVEVLVGVGIGDGVCCRYRR